VRITVSQVIGDCSCTVRITVSQVIGDHDHLRNLPYCVGSLGCS